MATFEVELDDGEVLTVEAPEEMAAQRIALSQRQHRGPGEGPLGLVPEGFRKQVRSKVETLPGWAQFIAETGPSMLGSTAGMFLPAQPLTVPALGAAGETLAQEIGLAPTSPTQIAAAGVAPGVFRLGTQAATKAGGAILRHMPAIRSALQAREAEILEKGLAGMGAKLRPTESVGVPFEAARKSGVQLLETDMPKTLSAINQLESEVGPLGSTFPEGQQILTLLGKAKTALQSGEFDFNLLDQLRRYVGQSVKKFEQSAGARLGASKLFYKSILEDLESMASHITTGPPATALRTGIERAKQAFAGDTLEGIIAKASKVLPGQEDKIGVNIPQIINTLKGLTDSSHPNYDAVFTRTVAPELSGIMAVLAKANRTVKGGVLTVKGPAALAVAQRVGAVGAGVGAAIAGPAGAALGAIMALQFPSAAAQFLMRPKGRWLLDRIVTMGKGHILPNAMALLTQATRGAGRDVGSAFSMEEEEMETPGGLGLR